MTLPERQRLILKEVVDRYIRVREPVSSRMILEDYGLTVSSATVRNDMNDLERQGYIAKPYSSSGRIPTEKGYRFFVEWLLDLSELAKREHFDVVETFEARVLDMGEAMRHAAFLLGSMTHYAAFVIPPRLEAACLERVVLARMSDRAAFLVIVSDTGIVEQGLIPLESGTSEAEIEGMMRTINRTLRGARLEEVKRMATSEETADGWHARPERQALGLIARLLEARVGPRIVADGLLHLLDAMQDLVPQEAMARFSSLSRTIQDEEALPRALEEARAGRRGIVVNVGDLPLTGFDKWSVVSCDYGPHNGVIGVIAPVWMDYGRAMSAAAFVSSRLEALLVAARSRGQERTSHDV
ncbi:MAG: heat-inducible transcriptional repressor HrcA [Candidatus Bipolaricaulota bacterium]|nr:heat-inducible transcriptional repressor HrcA [Candidatus Bipolaricaulota bacterium]